MDEKFYKILNAAIEGATTLGVESQMVVMFAPPNGIAIRAVRGERGEGVIEYSDGKVHSNAERCCAGSAIGASVAMERDYIGSVLVRPNPEASLRSQKAL